VAFGLVDCTVCTSDIWVGETNKVRSHKNNPKYLEYSNQIHMDKYICNKNE
jgi:hypothetical protein